MDREALRDIFNSLTLESEDHWDYRGKNNSQRDYVHGFCTYPAMMVPKMQREILDVCLQMNKAAHITLIDPFAGSGTVLVEGMLRGIDIIGIDINPLAVLLCKVKTTIIKPRKLNDHAQALLYSIDSQEKVILHKFDGINKWFTNQAIYDLSRIRHSILQEEDLNVRRFFWASFCEVVRSVSNSRDCTYKLHIKEQKDIDNYSEDAVKLFKDTLLYNIEKYKEFYGILNERGYLSKQGTSYKGAVKIVYGDAIEYLKHTKKKYDLIITSPPYGDNHTTVTYGQYSILPLRWIDYRDIDDKINENVLSTQCEIDNKSLGGRSSNLSMTKERELVIKKSVMLSRQRDEIHSLAPNQVNKLIAFYSDYDKFLAAISKRMKADTISVWTLGNRKIAKQEIYMDRIMLELANYYNLDLVTNFSRNITHKRMPKMNGYSGGKKGLQGTMTREHIQVYVRSENIYE